MSIQANTRTFGQRFNSAATDAAPTGDARPKANYWLNIGYVSYVKDEDGTYRFVSLAQGIPLDTLESLSVNHRNANYAHFRQAQNELRDDLIEEAKKLKPGEDFKNPFRHCPATVGRRASVVSALPAGESDRSPGRVLRGIRRGLRMPEPGCPS